MSTTGAGLNKPKAFIASSGSSIEYAYAIQTNLTDFESTVWDQGVFNLGVSTLDALLQQLNMVDFGIFIFGNDDTIVRGHEKNSITRDNVIYELGLFTGRLGRNRVFVVHPKNSTSYNLPTDLLGITIATFDEERADKNWCAALGPACQQIRGAAKNAEAVSRHRGSSSADSNPAFVAAVCCRAAGDQVEFLLTQTTRLRWIFPKGRAKGEEKMEAAALRYAYEEGGVIGEIVPTPSMFFKHLKEEEGAEQTYQFYLIHAAGKASPSAHFRNPRWATRSEAEKLVSQERPFKYIRELHNTIWAAEKSYKDFRANYVKQSGVVPYRITNNEMEILLITSTETQQWLFPKGNIEGNETPQEGARRETIEEAGVKGDISEPAIGIYDHEKLGKRYSVEMFAMHVTSELSEWPEDRIRRRKWVEVQKAKSVVQEEYLREIITDFTKLLKPNE